MLQKRDELIKTASESKAPVIDCVSKVRWLKLADHVVCSVIVNRVSPHTTS